MFARALERIRGSKLDGARRADAGRCRACGFKSHRPIAVIKQQWIAQQRRAHGDGLPPMPSNEELIRMWGEGFGDGNNLQLCICGAFQQLRPPHAVTALIHFSELARSSSTHTVLAKSIPGTDVAVWNSPEHPTATAVWDAVTAKCAVSGRTPVILYPSSDAVPVEDFVRSMRPEARAAGLHIVVLDGTWNTVRAIFSDLPTSAPRIVVRPTTVFTLFSPLRTQPAPGRVSTVEAVACVFDEYAAAMRDIARATHELAVDGGASAASHVVRALFAPSPGKEHNAARKDERNCAVLGMPSEASMCAGCDEAAAATAARLGASPAAHSSHALASDDAILRIPHAHTSAVTSEDDASAADVGAGVHLPSTRTMRITSAELLKPYAEYRSNDYWASRLRYNLMVFVDANCMDSCLLNPATRGSGYRTWYLPPNTGPFARLPAHLVTTIASFAYPAHVVRPDGYPPQCATGSELWADTLLDFHGWAEVRAAASAAIALPQRRGSQRARLPSPDAFTVTPLAHTCMDMYLLAAGFMTGFFTPGKLASVRQPPKPRAAAQAAAAHAAAGCVREEGTGPSEYVSTPCA
ncbi:DTW domain-containing protein [archaeon]|nr:MAG: DTW domain-containing protein [archaeon]